MIPTIFGVLVLVPAFIFMTRDVTKMLQLLLLSSLMLGSAAVIVTALGGATITPSMLVVCFLTIRLSIWGRPVLLVEAVRQNAYLVTFCSYSAITAFLFPSLFEGVMSVWSLTGVSYDIVQPSSQNITTAGYLMGTAVAAVGGYAVAVSAGSGQWLVKALLVAAWLHVGTGVADLALKAIGHPEVLEIFRNGSYAQLTQSVSGISRISGITPEPSAYAAYAGTLLVFMTELWLRNIAPRRTGRAALALCAMLVLAISSTGYLLVVAFGGAIGLRFLFVPGGASNTKAARTGVMLVAGLAGVSLLIALQPELARNMLDVIYGATLGKGQTDSAVQRSEWAWQAVDAFRASYGIGVGSGSFRSSSLILAILGSTGVIGVVLFLACLMSVLKPFRHDTYALKVSETKAIAAASAWAALLGAIVACFGAPSPDPGILFGVLAGASLGLRAVGARRAPAAITGSPGRVGAGVLARQAMPPLLMIIVFGMVMPGKLAYAETDQRCLRDCIEAGVVTGAGSGVHICLPNCSYDPPSMTNPRTALLQSPHDVFVPPTPLDGTKPVLSAPEPAHGLWLTIPRTGGPIDPPGRELCISSCEKSHYQIGLCQSRCTVSLGATLSATPWDIDLSRPAGQIATPLK